MTHDQKLVLSELSSEWSYTVDELAGELQLTPSAVKDALRILEARGLACREANSHPAAWRRVSA